jgi:hypothetical protein
MSKWVDGPHWEFDCRYLGSDQHGDWLGIPQGTVMTRPGATYTAPTHQVGLVPPPGPDAERGWLATFHDVGGPVRIYVDVTTPPVWDGTVLRCVDLDLDVIRGAGQFGRAGRVWVDDEDEFAEHRVSLGYPEELAQAALASCERVLGLVETEAAPYDGSAAAWLARLERERRP